MIGGPGSRDPPNLPNALHPATPCSSFCPPAKRKRGGELRRFVETMEAREMRAPRIVKLLPPP
jgi:hypothetical protein